MENQEFEGANDKIGLNQDNESVADDTNVSNQKLTHDQLLKKVVYNEEQAYELYRNYGFRIGFSVRKGKQSYYSGTKNIKTKDYYCSKEGLRHDDRNSESSFSKLDTRTGCKAMIRFDIDEQGVWRVNRFADEHNHILASPTKRHLLRSVRSVSLSKGVVLNSMVNAGIRTIDAYSYMAEEGGGAENIGFTKKDCYNYIDVEKNKLIEVGDSQSLVNHFRRKANEEGEMFYWDVQLDEKGRMTHFYWRDGRSKVDYDNFGDVVVFDTTYRTNRYDLVCAPFVGVNHHWKNVMFGCAFLLDEKTETFEWLFNTFLESMGNRAPVTIFTDQDKAMEKAIEKVLPTTRHRLCLWHISKNAASHLGTLNSNQIFHNLFNKCLQGCESETEFEETWAKMIMEYTDGKNKWLNKMYKRRFKWCTALNKDIFDGGIKSSQRSESTNNVLNGIANKSTSLTKFVIAFENMIKKWRKTEGEDDFNCYQKAPTRAIKCSNILRDAAHIYTHKLYKLFEKEYLDGCGALNFKEVLCEEGVLRYDCTMQGKDSRIRVVFFNMTSMELHCSCKKFETLGLLCSHALAILHFKNIFEIPKQFILKRWTKEAKTRIHSYCINKESLNDGREVETVWRNQAMSYAYDIVTMGQEHEETRQILWRIFHDGHKELKNYFKDLSSNNHPNKKNCKSSSICNGDNNEKHVLDPPIAKTKGVSNARFKGFLEKKKRKKLSQKKSTDKSRVQTALDFDKADNIRQEVFPTISSTIQMASIPPAFPTLLNQSVNLNLHPVQSCHGYVPNISNEVTDFTWNMSSQQNPFINLNMDESNLPFTSNLQGVFSNDLYEFKLSKDIEFMDCSRRTFLCRC
ncbi:protein FAR1-RELATED SEQUENCE 5-like [Mercurialis annua]|uniref:protein FAR1-RELATED SEQUENCE 5-like n=1 Tax=Mercurialis annua TaxID=3986 RepID=UPI0024ADC496|nr:protein FAR1-RELATED SEQUENCE 5-like [Mercurialis annua]